MNPHLNELKTAITRDRNRGTMVFDVRSFPIKSEPKMWWFAAGLSRLTTLADEYVSMFGFVGLGADWTDISRVQAQNLLCQILTRDMVSHEVLMPRSQAQTYATCFLDQFAPNGRMLTNGPFEHALLHNDWNVMDTSTADTGVVCADKEKIGLLWFGDQG